MQFDKVGDMMEKNWGVKEFLNQYIMIIAVLFFAGAFIAGKFSIAEFPVFSLVFFRFLIATVVIFCIMIVVEKDWKIKKEEVPLFLTLGAIGMLGYHVLFFLSLKYTTATNSSLIGATNPLVTAILVTIVFKERLKSKNIFSILIALFGVILIITNGDINVLLNLKVNHGDLLMFTAVFLLVIYAMISKKALKKHSPIKITSYAFLFCVILLIPFVIMEKPMEFLPKVSFNGWMSVIYMAICSSVVGYLIQQISLKRIGVSKTSLYMNLVPVVSMILAYFMLGESIGIIKILAAACIITGVIINTRDSGEIINTTNINEVVVK
jgi:drug/metabolite transporter (DMT)-like permease